MPISSVPFFSAQLMQWHDTENKRTMPWKGERDPYKIWLSEIILQQTRVQQGLAYFQKFVTAYPTIKALAAAADEEVYKMWEGLGYYSRCKNLLHSAREVAKLGQFPNTYESIMKLKGVGPYTASAIASFAYGLPYAVVDGNVFRVLSRFFGESLPIDSTKGKNFFNKLAAKLLYQPDPAAYNQAIMDLGATICTPQVPNCTECPLQKRCLAYSRGLISLLPVKEKQLVKTTRWFTYFIFVYKGAVLIKQRKEKGIWQNLHEFYLVESPKAETWNSKSVRTFVKAAFGEKNPTLHNISETYKQVLTHQVLFGQFILVEIHTFEEIPNYTLASLQDLSKLAFPKMIAKYLKELHYAGLIL